MKKMATGPVSWFIGRLKIPSGLSPTYSFMYSTWTRYNPFIVYASGDNSGSKTLLLR